MTRKINKVQKLLSVKYKMREKEKKKAKKLILLDCDLVLLTKLKFLKIVDLQYNINKTGLQYSLNYSQDFKDLTFPRPVVQLLLYR